MSLALEIEFLTGVCRAARGPANTAPDWPPQTDRVFSALVSAWAARGERAEERQALEWLERQSPPDVHASGHTARTTPEVFVPPNDSATPARDLGQLKWFRDYLARGIRPPASGFKDWVTAQSVLPETRTRKERRFPVARPDDPLMTLAWHQSPEPAMVRALDNIARDVGYVGHSASLVRCRFAYGNGTAQEHAAAPARRHIYPGRLEELERAYRTNPIRPVISPGAAVVPPAPEPAADPQPPGWLVLEAISGTVPDIRAAALVCRALRRALMSGYRRIDLAHRIPEVVSGHTPDRAPTRYPHLAIVPLAFTGFPHADGRVFGFALVPPPQTRLPDIPGFRAAFETIARYDPGEERRVLELKGAPLRAPLRLAPVGTETKRSLSPDPYVRPARVWASVTPIVLDRHLKRRDDTEVRDLVARACENTGLPRPDLNRIQVGKHSAIEGAPPSRPSSGEPPWMRWNVPEQLASRALVHAVIDFGDVTEGPVLLGAGRFTGLGLCRGLRGPGG